MTIPLLVALLAGVATFALVTALLYPRIARLTGLRRRALARLSGEAGQVVPEAANLRRDETATRQREAVAEGQRWWQILPALKLSRRTGLLLALLALGLGSVIAFFSGLPLLISVPLGVFVALTGTVIFLRMQYQKRVGLIADAIPEALEMIVRSLRVGFPISAALLHAGERMTGPLGEELRETAEKISFGQDTTSALYGLARRCHNADLQFFAAAVAIQLMAGGNLADLLERLSQIARARQQLRRKVNAITAEARWSGRFLSAFPVLAVGGLWVLNPGYFDALLESEAFVYVASVTVGLMVLNVLYMRWLSQLD